ncbi:hypothetical protein N9164_09910 [Draconibacterium sp.]|nr:hypothetical protein [Draconibacterium sp.]
MSTTKKFNKKYIGKGTQVTTTAGKELDIIKISISKAAFEQYKHEYENKEYLTFEVAKMQSPDNYGRTHTCYVSKLEEVPIENEGA